MDRFGTSAPGRRVLHIGGNAADARTIRDALAPSSDDGQAGDLEWVATLDDGLERLTTGRINAVLLDFSLPEVPGIEGLTRLLQAAPGIPVLVVGADDNADTARQVVAAGARDYLLTTHLDRYWLPRAIRDAIDQHPPQEVIIAEAERAGLASSVIGEAVVSVNASGRITYINRPAEEMTGWSRGEATGRRLEEVLQINDRAAGDPQAIPAAPATAAGDERPTRRGTLLRRDRSECIIEHSAAPIHDRLGSVIGRTIVMRDIGAGQALASQLSHIASHDPLTDLPNRMLLGHRLGYALSLAHRYKRRLAVLFLDIDGFKAVNQAHGHAVGDELLRRVAREVTTCVRTSDTVSRYGADEFVVVLAELHHAEDAAKGAQKIISRLSRPLPPPDTSLTVSIGISVYPEDGADAETLLGRADMALYRAKEDGRNGYRFFEPGLNQRAVQRQSIEAGLRRALDQHEFELFYQPKVNLKTGVIIGAEALIRWRHLEGGLVEPGQFVSIAADCGLMGPIGSWIVNEACRQMQAWTADGLRPIPVSVNICAAEFRNPDFLKTIVDTLQATSLNPRQLEIELTEGVLMADAAAATETLHGLKNLGVQLAIDDFGTGWSSFNHLKRLSLDAIKIDSSFVQNLAAGPKASLIVSAMIKLGKSLSHRVIAEGVETAEQLAFLQSEDCDEGQGFYFSRPLAAPEMECLLQFHTTLPS